MDDVTAELIPISLIESIIYDSNVFLKFIRNPNDSYFLNIKPESIAIAITQYMDYIIKSSNYLDRNLFDRVNYLCDYFKLNKYYDFDNYLEKTMNLISLQEIKNILEDDDIFNKFINFENNRDFFKSDIIHYLVSIEEMFEFYSKSNIEVSYTLKNRYKEIMKKYSLELKKVSVIDGYKSNDEINDTFLNEILKKVDLNDNKFNLAYSLYVELCKVVSFDVDFNALNQKMDNKIVSDIYNKKISEIDIKNNKIVCKTWAEIYQKLLEKVGISAKVAGNFHKYVLFDCDGTLIKADATNSFIDDDLIKINDITRVKLGLNTIGFTCMEENKDIDLPLKEAREKMNLKEKKINDEITYLEENYNSVVTKENIEIIDKLKTLILAGNSSSLEEIELQGYMLALKKIIFKNNIQNISFKPVYYNNGYNYRADMLFIIDYENEKHYILYSKNQPILEYSKEQINDMIANGLLVSKYYKEEENEYTNGSQAK